MTQTQALRLALSIGLLGIALLMGQTLLPHPARGDEVRPFKLEWMFATMTRGGPVATRAPEKTTFKTESDCDTFGTKMTPRMEDWVRGLVRADWDHPVGVKFQCGLNGNPT